MFKFFVLGCLSLLFVSISSLAAPPKYFTEAIDCEYRAVLFHMDEIIPKTDSPLAALPLFSPFSLLDIRPTKFKNVENVSDFKNVNLGVLGKRMLNISDQQITNLTEIVLCADNKCREQRISIIKDFLAAAKPQLEKFSQQEKLTLVQQTTPELYRINNTFVSPGELISYTPSKEAGFIPSANYSKYKGLAELPEISVHSKKTIELRRLMNEFSVAAVFKVSNDKTNIIFAGLADNHWGVVLHNGSQPDIDDTNHLGLDYSDLQQLSDTVFYYQTN